MAWELSGSYLANCSCELVCPCPVDGPPTSKSGQCQGALVFDVTRGNLDETDLSGTRVALTNVFPSNLTSGNWTVGIVVDEGASDEQFDALERIFRGQEGGPFGDLSGFYGEWLGAERGQISFDGGDTPSMSVGDGSATFEPLMGGDGTPTTVKNAPFGFAAEYKIGRAPAHMNVLGNEFDAIYGEAADFVFSSEQAEEAPKGRG
jgi:hypothetical protein